MKRVVRAARRLQMGSYTAGSAVVFVNADAGTVLLVDPTYVGYLSFPGGFKDRHETPLDAARREVMEEIGVVIEDLHPVGFQFQEEWRHVDVVFLSRDVPVIEGLPRPKEIRGYRWVSIPEAPPLLDEAGRGILAIALDALKSAGVLGSEAQGGIA